MDCELGSSSITAFLFSAANLNYKQCKELLLSSDMNYLFKNAGRRLRRIRSTRRKGNVHTPGPFLQLLVGPEARAPLMITQLKMLIILPSGYPAHLPLLEALVLGPTLISFSIVTF